MHDTIPLRYDDVTARLRETPRTWLVTGAAGFIGSHLVEELLRLGQWVRGADDFSSGTTDNLAEVEAIVGPANWRRYEQVTADLREPGVCERACAGVDHVLHHAATGLRDERTDELLVGHATNVDAFFRLLIAARDAKVRRMVYASSGSVYGETLFGPRKEIESPRPAGLEAATKVICETYAAAFHRCFGLPTTGLRYFNVFGPRQSVSSAIVPAWIQALVAGNDVILDDRGDVGRDFCFVRNVVRANVLAAVSDDQGGCGRRFNIGSGERTTLRHLYERLRLQVQPRCPALLFGDPVETGKRRVDLTRSFPDLRLAHWLLGYEPVERLDIGLRATCDWYWARLGPAVASMVETAEVGGAA